MKTVLVVGSGGREHALAWKFAQSPLVSKVIVAPGNEGIAQYWECWNFDSYEPSKIHLLASRCINEGVDLVVVGPDNALAAGIVDIFESHGVLIMGPRDRGGKN